MSLALRTQEPAPADHYVCAEPYGWPFDGDLRPQNTAGARSGVTLGIAKSVEIAPVKSCVPMMSKSMFHAVESACRAWP